MREGGREFEGWCANFSFSFYSPISFDLEFPLHGILGCTKIIRLSSPFVSKLFLLVSSRNRIFCLLMRGNESRNFWNRSLVR